MLSRLIGTKKKAGVPIYLNVYDLTPINSVSHWFGLGIYLSAIEAHDAEYAFGAHDYSSSGVFEVEPRRCPGFRFRESIQLGTIELDSKELRQFMVQMSSEYDGDTYNLLAKNCNHFCNDVSVRLTGIPIPAWVNRLATLGTLCSCLLLYSPAIRYPREFQGHKRGCKSQGCKGCIHVTDSLSIPSSRIQQVSVSSFLQPLKRIVSGWDDPYITRTYESLLKWKYAHMNSVDFKFQPPSHGYYQFRGSQPVSLSSINLQLLRQRYYYATWKADG